MSLVKKVAEVFLALSMTWLIGCQNEDGKVPAPEPSPIRKPSNDFGNFEALKAEVLVRDRTKSLVKFIKHQDIYLVNQYDGVHVNLSIFLKEDGFAYIYAFWVYPEYLKDGARLWRTQESVHEFTWELSGDDALIVGDEVLVISANPVDGIYSGSVKPRLVAPPTGFDAEIIPDLRTPDQGSAVDFKVVSETLESEVINQIFKR